MVQRKQNDFEILQMCFQFYDLGTINLSSSCLTDMNLHFFICEVLVIIIILPQKALVRLLVQFIYCTHGASPVAIKNPPAMQEPQEMWIQSLSRKIPWRREWLPPPVFLPGESHGQGSLVATVHRITKSWTQLKLISMHSHSVPVAGDRLMSKTPALLSRNRHEKSILSRG